MRRVCITSELGTVWQIRILVPKELEARDFSRVSVHRKGEADMCTVFEETRTEGRMEGRAEEIVETGYEFGLSEKDILERLQKKLGISLQKAKEYLEMFGRQTI